MQQPFADPHAIGIIHVEQRCSRPTDGRSADNASVGVFETLLPAIPAWMEQTHDIARVWIDSGEVGPFVQVTIGAGESEVFDAIATAVLSRHDVLDVEPQFRVLLRSAAVFAAMSGPLANQLAHKRVHQGALVLSTTDRASIFNTERSEFARTSEASSFCSSAASVPAVFLSANWS
jgi:hypothetical protein